RFAFSALPRRPPPPTLFPYTTLFRSRRRSRAGVEEGELAEHLPRAQDRQEVLPAVGGGAAELHLAVRDDVELVARVALVEEHLRSEERRVGKECRFWGWAAH